MAALAALVAVWVVPVLVTLVWVIFQPSTDAAEQFNDSSPWLAALQLLALEGVLVATAAFFAGRGGLRKITADRPGTIIILLSLVCGIAFSAVLTEIARMAIEYFPEVFKSDVLRGIAGMLEVSSTGAFLFLITLSVAAPLGEEILCRGLVLRAFMSRYSSLVAILLSAAIFAVLHMNATQSLCAFLFGLFAGACAVRTGSIWPAVAAHLGVNLTDSIAVFSNLVNVDAVLGSQGLSTEIVITAFAILMLCSGAIWFLSPAPVGQEEPGS